MHTLHNRLVHAHYLENPKLVESNTTMARKKNDYFPDLCRFMSYTHHGDLTHYPPETTTMFSGAQLLALTPNQVVRYFNFLVYGNPDPGTNELPKHMRKYTIQYKKKAISSYMPHHGEWNTVTNHGNPTRDKSVLAMIARMGKFQTRGQGRKSQVKRDLTMAEMKLCMEILDSDCNNWALVKWAAAARTQFHMISRGDCANHIQTKNFSQHPRFDFACQTKLNWSKNVRDERDCPFQIVLGAMNSAFCMLLSLAIYLEIRFSTFGYDSKFLFTEDYSADLPDAEVADDPAPLAACAAYSKKVNAIVFQCGRFIALAAITAGKIGMHSIRKCASTFAKRKGAQQDDVDVRGRWKGDKGGRTSTRYINPEQPYVDAMTCGHLCVDGPIKYKFEEGAQVGPAFFAEHVCPHVNAYFPASSKMAETLGPALLWGCYEPTVAAQRIPDWLVKKIKEAYEDCRPELWPAGVNPIERVKLSIYKVGELLCIDELPPSEGDGDGNGAAAPVQRQQQRSAGDQAQTLSILHSLNIRVGNLEEKVAASHGDIKQEIQQQLSHINKNISRIQLLAPTQRAASTGTSVGPIRPTSAQLGKPKCLHTLWVEYTHGLGGNKAAKDFTATEKGKCKQKYYRRRVFWNLVATLVNAGYGAPAAVDKVYHQYGRDSSVTKVLDCLLEDRKRYRDNGGVHPAFYIGRRRPVARRDLTHLPQTQANRAQPQQNTMRRYMIEQRALPTHQARQAPLARLQQRAAAQAVQQRESLGADGTTRPAAAI